MLQKSLTFLLILVFGTTYAQKQSTEDLLKAADSCFLAMSYREASLLYEKALKQEKKNPTIRTGLADAYLALSDSSLSFQSPEKAKFFYEENLQTRYQLKNGFMREREKKFRKSLAKADATPQEYEEISRRYIEIGNAFMAKKQFQPAKRIFDKAAVAANMSGVASLVKYTSIKKAECYVELENFPAARKIYTKTLGGEDQFLTAAADFYCDAEMEKEAEKYASAARLFALIHKIDKTIKPEGAALMAARSYWSAREVDKALFWYGQLISEKKVQEILMKDEILEVRVGQSRCGQLNDAKSLVETALLKNSDYFYYAQALLNGRGKFLLAHQLLYKFYVIFESEDDKDQAGEIYVQKTYLIEKLPYPINTDESNDFSPAIYSDSLFAFVSDRASGNREKPITSINGEQRSTTELFMGKLSPKEYNLYYQIPVADTTSLERDIRNFFGFRRQLAFNEGPIVFYGENKDKALFTANSYDSLVNLKKEGGINTLAIYQAEKLAGKDEWAISKVQFSGRESAYFNSGKFSLGHPTLSKDKKRMYFASDAPIGFGKSDLYYSDFDTNTNRWQTPVNLGPLVNTEANEVFPFLHTALNGDETLYFSSNAAGGFGGLDIYESVRVNQTFSLPVNLREKVDAVATTGSYHFINSDKDDFGFIMNPEGTAGFFSSDRDGTDDIYQFKTIRVEIYVFDEEDRTPIPSSSIALYEAGNLEPIDARLTNSEGMLLFQRFEFNKTYDAVASARKYRPNKTRFNTEIPTLPFDGVIRDTIYLKRRPSVDIIILANQKSENQVFLSFNKDVIELNDTELLRKDELYELFDNAGINTLVNTRNPGEKVIVFDQFPIFRLNDLTDVQNQNRLTEILEKKYIIVKSITLIQNIRYNFATSDFGNDVVPEEQFTKVANVLRKFDHLLLKLSSHTDRCPLDGNYDNQALSQRRNAAAHRFILQTLSNAPFDVNRIKTCAYTFEYPVDDNYGPDGCKNDFNRRTEFKFIYRGRDKYREDVMCHPDAIQFIKEEDRSTVKRRQP